MSPEIPITPAATKGSPTRRNSLLLLLVLLTVTLVLIQLLGATARTKTRHASDDASLLGLSVKPRKPLKLLPTVAVRMVPSHNKDYVFCYIPKNGCSHFKRILLRLQGLPRNVIHGPDNPLPNLGDLPVKTAMSLLRNESVTKFVIVRNPYSRFVSAYRDKIVGPFADVREYYFEQLQLECPRRLKGRTMPKVGPLLSLSEFVQCLGENAKTNYRSDVHWRPQTKICGLDNVQYQLYIPLERLKDYIPLLMSILGNVTREDFLPKAHSMTLAVKKLKELFTEKERAILERYYKDDFDLLKYSTKLEGEVKLKLKRSMYALYRNAGYVEEF